MKKKLPNIYKGMVKNSNQNQKQSFISHEREENIYENEENLEKIFSHKNVYKANVSIKLVDGTTQEKTIVGRTNNSIITIDDELIDVSKISQIDFLD